MKRIRALLTFLTLAFLFLQPVRAASGTSVLVLTIDGPIAPAAREYLKRGLQVADQLGVEAVILQLNTPGGSITIMNDMEQEMLASSVPVIVYVQPRGAWAASAGTVITLAAHASAMAPDTTIGAASPVGSQGENLPTTEQTKQIEALKATVRALAARRGPEAIALAQSTIESATAVSSTEALQAGLVDFIAPDLNDLLRQLDGFTVHMADGSVRTLHTAGAEQQPLAMSFIEELLNILTDPNIVFLLLAIGVQAILIEISSPGGWIAGFVGAICLALAAYGLGILNVNWFGLFFFLLAFVLFIVDIKASTHGGLTAAGIGSFIVGALVLFNSPGTPSFQRVSLPLIIFVAVFLGLTFAVIVGLALRARKVRVRTGAESLAGGIGVAVSDFDPGGQVQSAGELWSAEAVEGSGKIHNGDRVEVVKVEGLRLKVRKKG